MPNDWFRIHPWWFQHRSRAFLSTSILSVFIALFGAYLGIASDFTIKEVPYSGFFEPLWVIVLLLLPVAVLFTPWFVATVSNAIDSLDKIVMPNNKKAQPFGNEFKKRFKKTRKLLIIYTAAFAIGLTLLADWRDIFSPLKVFSPSPEKDWSQAAMVMANHSKWLFLIFNILAFGIQTILIYCGFLILSCLGYALVTFLKASSSNTHTWLDDYDVNWDFSDSSGRCGLYKVDRVYMLFTVFMICAILATQANVTRNHPDLGSFLLILFSFLVFPLIGVLILVPYWVRFPKEVPPRVKQQLEKKGEAVPKPSPWPFGSTWSLTVVLGLLGTWGALLPRSWNVLKEFISTFVKGAGS